VTRGERNNNPGNIRLGIKWQGMAPDQTDPAFVQFQTPEWGVRAIARILLSYEKDGITTIRGIINRWAPPSDNNPTDAYIKNVSTRCNIAPDDYINITDQLFGLVSAIIYQENGEQPYPDNTIHSGIALC
jgi:hypothetical protein